MIRYERAGLFSYLPVADNEFTFAIPEDYPIVTMKPDKGRVVVIAFGKGGDGFVCSAHRRTNLERRVPKAGAVVLVQGMVYMRGGLFKEALLEAWGLLEGDKARGILADWVKRRDIAIDRGV